MNNKVIRVVKGSIFYYANETTVSIPFEAVLYSYLFDELCFFSISIAFQCLM